MKVIRSKKFLLGFLLFVLGLVVIILIILFLPSEHKVECFKSKYFRKEVSAEINEAFKVYQCQSVVFNNLDLRLNRVTFQLSVGGLGIVGPGMPQVGYDVVYKNREYSLLTELPFSLHTLESDYKTYSIFELVEKSEFCEEKRENANLCWYEYATQTSLNPNDCRRITETSSGGDWRYNCLRILAENYFPELCNEVNTDRGWCGYQNAISLDDPQICGQITSLFPMLSCFKYFVDNRGLDCTTLDEESDISKCERQKERYYEILDFLDEVKSSNDINDCQRVMEFNLYKDCYRHFARIQRNIGDEVCEQVVSEVQKALCNSSF